MAVNWPSRGSSRLANREPEPERQRDRGSDCTHITLSRLYMDGNTYHRCSLCAKVPSAGWLYRCTQDFNGFLPASDFNKIDTARRLENDAQLYTLSPSVTEAAAKGHYTKEQLAILWKQKTDVRKLVQQIRPTTSSSASTASTSSYSIAASASYSTFPSSESETDLDQEVPHRTDCFPMHRGFLETIPEVHDDLEKDDPTIPFAKTTAPVICDFKVCDSCRHRHINRDKAFASIDGVLKTPYRQLVPSVHEFQNKRISDINVVRNLGASTASVERERDLRDLPFNPVRRHSGDEFRGTFQDLLRGQGPSYVPYAPTAMVGNAQPQGLLRQTRYTNLAAIDTSSLSRSDTFHTSITESASFGNCNTTLSTVETFCLPDDDGSSASSCQPRPIFNRRGLERMDSIQVPPRSAVSHSNESSSSQAPLTNQSTLSCPGVIERAAPELVREDLNWYARYNAGRLAKSHPMPETAMDITDDQSQPNKTSTELISGGTHGIKWTPEADPRFFID